MLAERTRGVGTDLMFYHIKSQQVEEVLQLLTREEVSINQQDINGETALHVATGLGYSNIVRLLLSQGADPNIASYTDVGHMTPLLKASEQGRLDIAEMLVKAGADLDVRNRNGQTALILAIRNSHSAIAKFLVSAGADLEQRDLAGCNAGFYAKQLELTELVDLLPAPVTMKGEELVNFHNFVRQVIGSKPKEKKGKGKKKGKKGKKKK